MKRYVCIIFLILPINSFAGAWGVGSFENDSALDWVYELERASSLTFLNHTFSKVLGTGNLQVDECSAALAAAEIVATINNNSLSKLPEEVKVWASKHSNELTQKIKSSAAKAISSCANSKISEVAQLWEESAPSEWSSYISDLESRLK